MGAGEAVAEPITAKTATRGNQSVTSMGRSSPSQRRSGRRDRKSPPPGSHRSRDGASGVVRPLDELAEVRGRLAGAHVEAALPGDLEGGPGGVVQPLGGAVALHPQLAAEDGHPLGAVRAEVKLTRGDHADGGGAAVARVADALHLTVEVAVVLQDWGRHGRIVAAASTRR